MYCAFQLLLPCHRSHHHPPLSSPSCHSSSRKDPQGSYSMIWVSQDNQDHKNQTCHPGQLLDSGSLWALPDRHWSVHILSSSLSSFSGLAVIFRGSQKVKRNHSHTFTFTYTEDYWRWMVYSSLVLLWFSLWDQYMFCLTPQSPSVWWMLYQHKIWLTQLICKSKSTFIVIQLIMLRCILSK